MRRPSSISAFRSPAATLVLLTLCSLGVWVGTDLLLQRMTSGWKSPEWVEKCRVWDQKPDRRGVDTLFVGDSLVSIGVRPGSMGIPAFNFGRSSFLPAELDDLSKRLLALDAHPRRICLSITVESFFHPNTARFDRRWEEGALISRNYYRAPNLAGFFWFPGRISARQAIVQRLLTPWNPGSRTYVIDATGARVPAPGFELPKPPPFAPDPGCDDPRLLTQAMRNLGAFKAEWTARGAQVFWVEIPASRSRTQAMAQAYPQLLAEWKRQIREVFGEDIISPRFTPSELDFPDGLHLANPAALEFSGALASSLERAAAP